MAHPHPLERFVKKADPTADAFAGAVQNMAAGQLKTDALGDVGNMAMLGLGAGAAGRGIVGLINLLRTKPKRTRSGPAVLPLSYPVKAAANVMAHGEVVPHGHDVFGSGAATGGEYAGRTVGGFGGAATGGLAGLMLGGRPGPDGKRSRLKQGLGAGVGGLAGLLVGRLTGGPVGRAGGNRVGNIAENQDITLGVGKQAGFLDGDSATTKAGIPWYTPAMIGVGLGGLAAGWKGLDAVLQKRREAQQKDEMDKARSEYHDALMGSYAGPVAAPAALVDRLKRASDSPMAEAGRELDALFEKLSVDWSNLGGAALGGYGTYAGLSGLLAGAMVYDRMNKRSRRSVLEKALQRRQRRRFMQSPTELQAIPEPVAATPQSTPMADARLIAHPEALEA